MKQKIEVQEWDGIEREDHPEYCDAYASEATINGVPMTDDQLDEFNDSDLMREIFHEVN